MSLFPSVLPFPFPSLALFPSLSLLFVSSLPQPFDFPFTSFCAGGGWPGGEGHGNSFLRPQGISLVSSTRNPGKEARPPEIIQKYFHRRHDSTTSSPPLTTLAHLPSLCALPWYQLHQPRQLKVSTRFAHPKPREQPPCGPVCSSAPAYLARPVLVLLLTRNFQLLNRSRHFYTQPQRLPGPIAPASTTGFCYLRLLLVIRH